MNSADPHGEIDRAEIQAAIGERFGSNADLARSYAALLVGPGIERGMIGPREADRIWERHLLNSAALAPLCPEGGRVVDLGSGAGLPGIPVAIARPDLEVVLLEPMQRRVNFLTDCLAVLDLPHVTIHHGRAQDGVTPRVNAVVARAVATLPRLVEFAARLLVPDGMLLALKGEGVASEVEQVNAMPNLHAEVVSVPCPGHAATVVQVTGEFPVVSPPPRRSARRHR